MQWLVHVTNADILAGQLSEVSTVIFVFKYYDNIFLPVSEKTVFLFFVFLIE